MRFPCLIAALSTYLINKHDVAASIPAPLPCLCSQFPLCQFYNLTRAIFEKHANHTTTAWSPIEPDSKWSYFRAFSRLKKPKERVDRVVLLNGCEGKRWEV